MEPILSEKIIKQVYNIILERKNCSPENSYVSSLFNKGKNSILKKIGEESTEVIIASQNGNIEEQIIGNVPESDISNVLNKLI